MDERDHIGPDPIAWLERLLEVNRGSAFDPDMKQEIAGGLHALIARLKLVQSGKHIRD